MAHSLARIQNKKNETKFKEAQVTVQLPHELSPWHLLLQEIIVTVAGFHTVA
jgi:hypothetical protein